MIKFNYSTTSNITAYMTKDQANKEEHGWTLQNPVDWDEIKIKQLLTYTSLSPNVFVGGHRTKKNYEKSVHIMIDFDSPQPPQGNGLTFEEVKSLVKIYFPNTACAMFASNSNKKPYRKFETDWEPHEKFRLVFPIATAIDSKDLENLKTFFLEKFDGKIDHSSFDCYRYFYKGNSQLWYFQDGEYIDLVKYSTKTKNQSIEYLTPTTKITLLDGTETIVSNITDDEICYCSFHPDKSASAKIFINEGGHRVLHCSSCKSRGLGTDGQGNYFYKIYDTTSSSDIVQNKVTVFYSLKHNQPVMFNASKFQTNDNSDISKKMFQPIRLGGVGWEIFCNNYKFQSELLKYLPMLDLHYNPKMKSLADVENKTFNYFIETDYMKVQSNKIKPDLKLLEQNTPFIHKILKNVIGTDDAIQYYLNWFATILQERPQSIKTCLLLMDEKRGIGKDILFERVWQPIFGTNAVASPGSKMGNKFNSKLANVMLVRFNEVFNKGDRDSNFERANWLKDFVGSSTKEIEPKGVDAYDENNFTGIVLHSNYYDNSIMDTADRRISVFENRSSVKIDELFKVPNLDEYIKMQCEKELDYFASYINSVEIDTNLANKPFESHIRNVLQYMSRDVVKEFADVLKDDNISTEDKTEFFDIENAILQHPSSIKLTKLDNNGCKYEPKLPTHDELVEIVNHFITKKSIPVIAMNVLLLHKGVKALETAKNQLVAYNISQYEDLTTKKRFRAEYTTKTSSFQKFKKEYYLFKVME